MSNNSSFVNSNSGISISVQSADESGGNIHLDRYIINDLKITSAVSLLRVILIFDNIR